MIKKMFLAVMAMGIFATSCSSDDDSNGSSAKADLTLNLSGLGTLGDDSVYEGWIIVDEKPVSTGVFSSVTFPQTFKVDADQLAKASLFVLTIEPRVDVDPRPAATKILRGDFDGNTASLNTAIVGDFRDAAGSFFLRTPTDDEEGVDANDESGVWFGTPAPGGPPTPNFDLPELSDGWAYEGWVVGENGPITTGTFTAFDMADDFSGFSAQTNPGPPIPGEDFLLNAPEDEDGNALEVFPLDVRGRTVVISVEPVPDDSPAPFAIKPLVGVAGQETAPATHSLSQNLGSLPTGTVTR